MFLKEIPFGKVNVITTEKELLSLADDLNKAKHYAVDTETTGLNILKDRIIGISICHSDGVGYYIPIGHVPPQQLDLFEEAGIYRKDIVDKKMMDKAVKEEAVDIDDLDADEVLGEDAEILELGPKELLKDLPFVKTTEQLDKKLVLSVLKPILETKPGFYHNAKYDLHMFHNEGIYPKVLFDSAIASKMTNENFSARLKDCVKRIFKVSSPIKFGDLSDAEIYKVPICEAAVYASADAIYTYKLCNFLKPTIDGNEKYRDLYYNLELALIPALMDIERTGIILDKDKILKIKSLLIEKKKQVEKDLNKTIKTILDKKGIVPWKVNWDSPKQVSDLIYRDLGVPPRGAKYVEGAQFSTDKTELIYLLLRTKPRNIYHKFFDSMLTIRKYEKLINTYTDRLLEKTDDKGIAHTDYNQVSSKTSRLITVPNWQNFPRPEEFGGDDGKFAINIRNGFVARPGYTFVISDWSAVELKLTGFISGDEKLLSLVNNPEEDTHCYTASIIYGIPYEHFLSVIKDKTHPNNKQYKGLRQIAKRASFTILYGATELGLATILTSELRQLISERDASLFITSFFRAYPGIKVWMDSVKDKLRTIGYSESLMGRRRRVGTHPTEAKIREAINFPIQCSAAEILKKALIGLYNDPLYKWPEMRTATNVHDEIATEVLDNPKSIELAKSLHQKHMEVKLGDTLLNIETIVSKTLSK